MTEAHRDSPEPRVPAPGEKPTPVMRDKATPVDTDELVWLDISNEAWREYTFPGGEVIRVANPVALNSKRKPEGDSHRIKAFNTQTRVCRSHYIRAGWLRIEWEAKDPFKFVYDF